MYHEFSVLETLKTAWNVLKKNFIPLVVYAAISLFINELIDFFNVFIFVGEDKLSQFIIILIQLLIQSYLVLSFYKLILTLMDKEYYEFEFKEIIPSFRMTFNFLAVILAYALLVLLILIVNDHLKEYETILNIFEKLEMLFILFLILKSIFCVCFIVDDNSHPIESLKQSFAITKDNFFKTLAMFFIVIAIMIAVMIPIIALIVFSGINEDTGEYIFKLAFYCWFILTFPFVQVIIMVTYRKLVYSHLDVEDDDIAETN